MRDVSEMASDADGRVSLGMTYRGRRWLRSDALHIVANELCFRKLLEILQQMRLYYAIVSKATSKVDTNPKTEYFNAVGFQHYNYRHNFIFYNLSFLLRKYTINIQEPLLRILKI